MAFTPYAPTTAPSSGFTPYKAPTPTQQPTAPQPSQDSFASLAMKTARQALPFVAPGVDTALKVGDFAVHNPSVLPTAGGIVGGIAGSVLGAGAGGIGAIPGGGLGAAGGAAIGKELQQGIQGQYQDPMSLPSNLAEAGKTGAVAGATQMAGDGFFSLLKAGGQAISPALAPIVSKFTGYGSSLTSKALERSPATVSAANGGEDVLNSEVGKTASNLVNYAKQTLKDSQATVTKLNGMSGGGKGYPGTRQAILDTGKDFMRQVTDSLRAHNIGVNSVGALNFNRSTLPSNIVSGSDGKTIQDGYNLLNSISKDTSIKNIDAVIERLMVLKSKTPAGTPTGPQTKAIVGDMMNSVKDFVGSLGTVSPAYTQYKDFLETNLPQRVFINEAKDLFGSSKHLSAEDTASLTKRMLATFNSGNSAVKGFAEDVGNKVGTDPVGAAAGSHISSDQFNIRAPGLDRAVLAKVFEVMPRALVKNYVQTGNLFSLETHPLIQMAAHLLGTSVKAVSQYIANQATDTNN